MNYQTSNYEESYRIVSKLSDKVWDSVISLKDSSQETIGYQLIYVFNNILAHISEGNEQYFKNDKVKFYHYSKGMVMECVYWLEESFKRNLITEIQHSELKTDFEKLLGSINRLIKFTNLKLKK